MKVLILSIIISFASGYVLSKYLTPEKIKYVDKIKVVERKNVRTVTVTKEVPGGVKIITVETVDRSEVNVEKEHLKETLKPKSQWLIGPSVGVNFSNPKPIYGGVVQRRILGPLFVGAYGNTEGAGLIALFEF